jgi:lambda family phage tail tape measure protein
LERLTAEQRKAAEADFYAYVNAIRRKDAQDSKTELEKMADQWARLGDQMDKAATGWVSNFVDGLATGKMNMADFARSVLEGLAKIIIQALIAKAIIAALGAFGLTGAQDSNLSIPTPGGIPFGDSIGAVGASVVQAHSGGVLGGDRGMASMVVDPSIFTNAMKYHVGGIAGLRPGEVPAVLQEGEGVFTKAQMAAMGGGQQPVNVQVDVVVDAMTRPGPMRDAVRSTT